MAGCLCIYHRSRSEGSVDGSDEVGWLVACASIIAVVVLEGSIDGSDDLGWLVAFCSSTITVVAEGALMDPIMSDSFRKGRLMDR